MQVTAYKWVPDFARGYVRDLWVRWALEEVELPYTVRLIDLKEAESAEYLRKNPFGEVPVLEDGDLTLFESGSIVLYIGEKSEKLLPKALKVQARTWVIAALNSIDPYVRNFTTAYDSEEQWAKDLKPTATSDLKLRLADLSRCLEGHQYLTGDQFTAGDLMMAGVLRNLNGSKILLEFPVLNGWMRRCLDRPPFKKALADQLKVFADV